MKEEEKLIEACDQVNKELVNANNEVIAIRNMLVLLLQKEDKEALAYAKQRLLSVMCKERIIGRKIKTIGF